MMTLRITDEMRNHMFENWSKEQLQSIADFECSTISEVKERLLEFAAFHGLDSLDHGPEGHGDNANYLSQMDGPAMDYDTLNAPQTPLMSSPMSQKSDGAESVFEVGASVLTTPSTPYISDLATLKVADNGSPVKRSTNNYNRALCQTDGPDDHPESRNRANAHYDSFAVDADGQPITRMFDPQKSLKYGAVDAPFLLDYDAEKKVLHLQGFDLSTSRPQSDPTTLVISIDSVVYEEASAGAAVFFHPLSPWNTVTWVKGSKKNAKLEALFIALNMIRITAANDPNLKAVVIRCTGRGFCLANANAARGNKLQAWDRNAVAEWLQGVSESTLEEVDELWTNITRGNTDGRRAVDVRLWCVSKEDMQETTEAALAYMYEQRGRDWYAENGKGYPEYDEPATTESLEDLEINPIVAPSHIIDQGAQAAMRWTAAARARLRQCFLHKVMASAACRDLNGQLRAGEGMAAMLSMKNFFEAYALATRWMSECPQKQIDQFAEDQRNIRYNNQLAGRQMDTTGVDYREVGDDSAERLTREVLKMGWEMEWE
jgi:hypothetical protein